MQSPLAIYCLTHGMRSSIHPETIAEQTRKRKARRRTESAEAARRMLQAVEGSARGLRDRALKRSPSYEERLLGTESGEDADWRDWGIYSEPTDKDMPTPAEMYCLPVHLAEEIKRTLTGAYCEGNVLLADLEATHVPTILNSNPCYRTMQSITEATRRAVNSLAAEGSVRAVLSNAK